MGVQETIEKKRRGVPLSSEEIKEIVLSYTRGDISDETASDFLRSVFDKGMDEDETMWLTRAMMESGEVVDLSGVCGRKIDKHSTGGVGDKVTLVLAPLVAACGVKVPMISGRGLGHTGGTIDKLEAIPGFRTGLSVVEFVKDVDDIGVAIMTQSDEIVPADKKLYALRDVTGLIASIPLITSSIMSKKLAEGIDGLVLDIKVGNGAFMKTEEEAEAQATSMIAVGKKMKREAVALLTDMNQPLGRAVGNAVEVEESIAALKGKGPTDLMEVVFVLGEQMLVMAEVEKTSASARRALEECVSSGRALDKFRAMVERQGGDAACLEETTLLGTARKSTPMQSVKSGYVEEIDTYAIGAACVELGGGRKVIGEEIDRGVGFMVNKKIGDAVEEGEVLLDVLCDDSSKVDRVLSSLKDAYRIGGREVERPELVRKLIA